LSNKNEEKLRMMLEHGKIVDHAWLRNHAHLSEVEINELVDAGVLTTVPRNKSDFMDDDKYILD